LEKLVKIPKNLLRYIISRRQGIIFQVKFLYDYKTYQLVIGCIEKLVDCANLQGIAENNSLLTGLSKIIFYFTKSGLVFGFIVKPIS
jgi:hypothetical protein